jgi:YD repeat-containing protein
LNDRVVLADFDSTGTTGVRVLARSSGRLLYQRSYSRPPPILVSSHDGKYLAEMISTYDSQGKLLASVTMIRRTSDGQVVARINNRGVLRFSWDDLRAVTGPFFAGAGSGEVDLIAWQTGKILWRQPGDTAASSGQPVFAIAQPSGPGMAIAIGSQPANGEVDQLWLVGAEGQATQAVNEVFYPAFYSGF